MQVLKCARKILEPQWVEQESRRIGLILASLSPQSLYLFGSAAEAKMTDQSDFDFLIVFEDENRIRIAQKALRPHFPLSDYPVDLVWVTQERFSRMKEIGGICWIAFKEGVCLHSGDHP